MFAPEDSFSGAAEEYFINAWHEWPLPGCRPAPKEPQLAAPAKAKAIALNILVKARSPTASRIFFADERDPLKKALDPSLEGVGGLLVI